MKLLDEDTAILSQAILYGVRDLRLETIHQPHLDLKEHEVLVRTETTAMSTGTELGNYLGGSTQVPGAPSYPRNIGYCNVGKVERAGSKVTRLYPGQRVFSLRPHLSAYRADENDLLVPVPDAVSSDQASLCYLAQLGAAALRSARYEAGERVAVIGLGVIGLATVALARAMGAQVTAVGNHPSRTEAAMRIGAHQAFTSCAAVDKDSVDVVVHSANSWESYRCAVEIARRGGRISILGFPGRNLPPAEFNLLDPSWFYAKQLHIIAAGGSLRLDIDPEYVSFNLRRNLEFVLRLMANGDVDLTPVISHRFPWQRMREAYELASLHDKSLMAAIFDWKE